MNEEQRPLRLYEFSWDEANDRTVCDASGPWLIASGFDFSVIPNGARVVCVDLDGSRTEFMLVSEPEAPEETH